MYSVLMRFVYLEKLLGKKTIGKVKYQGVAMSQSNSQINI